ncbi:MAG: hypothetical protein CVV64_09870 [Candidatus Wallbacteria bacterium HGW-Wallbacteria-1]|uniref:Metallo-beta-lactamase domain-containing protein n=1 Tax=Candidatus Wallbacteria bacterium HGW-Wallbacteria-1 TaxID=2013854 RepID=A0A2N1PPL0_9BACT|nr:MAG: hypothetical protein CVV64_09870 [Candidatus Wallbacteria bacterium HGW-Wallbacteria-1]
MKISVLGSAGAAPSGGPSNPFNCFFLHEAGLLLEAPPDAVVSLGREGIPISSIRSIMVSHLHGDHVFGLPFLFLALRRSENSNIPQNEVEGKGFQNQRILLLGPAGTGKAAVHLTQLAFGEGSSTVKWLHDRIMFIPFEKGKFDIKGINHSFVLAQMDHPVPTFGFAMWENSADRDNTDPQQPILAYLPDTLWSDGAINLVRLNPRTIIIDMGGGPGTSDPFSNDSSHLTARQAIDGISLLAKRETLIIGTHLDRNPQIMDSEILALTDSKIHIPDNLTVAMARPGMKIHPESRKITEE